MRRGLTHILQQLDLRAEALERLVVLPLEVVRVAVALRRRGVHTAAKGRRAAGGGRRSTEQCRAVAQRRRGADSVCGRVSTELGAAGRAAAAARAQERLTVGTLWRGEEE